VDVDGGGGWWWFDGAMGSDDNVETMVARERERKAKERERGGQCNRPIED